MTDGKDESSPPDQLEKPKTNFLFLKMKNLVKILKVEKYVIFTGQIMRRSIYKK